MKMFPIPSTEAKQRTLLKRNTELYWDTIGGRISDQCPEVRLAIAKALEQWIDIGPTAGTPMYENDSRVVPAEMLLAPVRSKDDQDADIYLAQIRRMRPPGPCQPVSDWCAGDDDSPGDAEYDPEDPTGEFAGASCYWADDEF